MIYERLRQVHYDKEGNVLEKIEQYNVYNRQLKYNFNTLLPEHEKKQLSNSEHSPQQPNRKWYLGYLIGVLSIVILLCFLLFMKSASRQDVEFKEHEWESIPDGNDFKEGVGFGL